MTLFSVLFPHVEPAFSIFLAIYSQSYSALLWLYFCISVHNYAFFDATFIAISTKLRYVLVLIALYFGAKRSAFWCLLQCVLVLFAMCFAANCCVFARNSMPFRSNSIFMQNWNDLYSFEHVVPFVQKLTFVRIDYLRPSMGLFANVPLLMLKYCFKS